MTEQNDATNGGAIVKCPNCGAGHNPGVFRCEQCNASLRPALLGFLTIPGLIGSTLLAVFCVALVVRAIWSMATGTTEGALVIVAGAFGIAISLLGFAVFLGLRRGKYWAWEVIQVLMVAGIAYSIIRALDDSVWVIVVVVQTAITAALLAYLRSSGVRAFCSVGAAEMRGRDRLCVMMFLQYMMFAVWWVQLAAYVDTVGVTGILKALILSSMPLGCLVAPVFCMIADRHFASQKVLMVLNLACAVLFFLGAQQSNPTGLFVILLLGMLCYMPTWSLTNAIAMANAPSEKFPQIRLFGSIGWVAAAVFSLVASKNAFGNKVIDGTAIPLYCGAATALLAVLLNLTLPNTPPPAKGKPSSLVDVLGLRALTLLKDRNFALFILISMLVMLPFTMYFSLGSQFFKSQGFEQVTATMNLGQLVEMGVMLLVPLALARYGARWAMGVGLGALLVRYAAFWGGGALHLPSLYYVAILVHGVIYGFFFVGGQVYVDKKAPPEIRAQAQGLIVLICFGVGMLIGTFFNVNLIDVYTVDKVTNWDMVWVVITVMTAVLLAGYYLLFRDDVMEKKAVPAAVAPSTN
jgi:nucleoside transporter